MPISGIDRMPGTGLARGTLFSKELNTPAIEVITATVTGSIVLEKSCNIYRQVLHESYIYLPAKQVDLHQKSHYN